MNNPVSNTLALAKQLSKDTFDSLSNALTGLGIAGKDKRLGAAISQVKYLAARLEAMHDQTDLGQLAVNKIPSLGTKKWIAHKLDEKDGGVDMVNKIVDEEDRLKVKAKIKKVWSYARLYGGAGLYISVDDGLNPSEPINLNRIVKVNNLVVLSRDDLSRGRVNEDIDDPNFGMPDTYRVSTNNIKESPEIHHSRILLFNGLPLSEQQFIANDYWGNSVLNPIYQQILDYNSAYAGVSNAMQDFDSAVLKLKNLADIVGGDDSKLLQERLRLMQLSKSIMSATILDAEDEDFQRDSRQFANVDKVLEKLDNRMVMALDLPHTLVLGQGSSGSLSGAGESEQSTLNDVVAGEQDNVLTSNLDKLYPIIFAAKQGPSNGDELKSWTYVYNPLSEPTAKQQAEARKLVAEADEIYVVTQVLSPNEVAKARFAGDEYSAETKIEEKGREEQNFTNELDPKQTDKIMKGIGGKDE